MSGNGVTRSGRDGASASPRRGGRVYKVIFVVACIVLAASLATLGAMAFSYWQGQQKYRDIADLSQFDPEGLEDDLDNVHIDWDALTAANPDTVGWIYVPNTTVNYPIVQGGDNNYYLYRDFDGNEGWLAEIGSVFLDSENSPEWDDQSVFVYGHHLNDGSMFAPIAQIDSQERFDECRTVYIMTPHGNAKLRSYSYVHFPGYAPFVELTFDTREKFTEYIQDKMDRSEYDPGDVPEASRIGQSVALSTCDNSYVEDGRYVMFCYVEKTTAAGLSGDVGIATDDEGAVTGFENDLGQETDGPDVQ